MSEPTFADDMKELMKHYDSFRAKWLAEFGTDDGFNAWFTERLMGGKACV